MVDIIKYNNRYEKDLYRLYGKVHGVDMKYRELSGYSDNQSSEKKSKNKNIMLLDINKRIKGYMAYKPSDIWNTGSIVNIDEIYIEKGYDTKANYAALINSVKKVSIFKSHDYAKISLTGGKSEAELINKLDLEPSKKLFRMKTNVKNKKYIFNTSNVEFIHFRKGKDEAKRVELQNSIFKDTDGHVDLTINDILDEEHQNYFLEDGGIFISIDGNLAGYSQIILEREPEVRPYIVNFGIAKMYRHQGLGLKLLEYTLNVMKSKGFDDVYVNVDAENFAAYKLYKSVGFCKVLTLCNYLYKYR